MPTSKTPIDPTSPPPAPQPHAPTPHHDSMRRVSLDLLDANPWQPRTSMDERKLVELVESIRVRGLLQAIVVMLMPDGRYLIVAGHRRVAAVKRLREEATTESERQKWNTINAVLKVGLVDIDLAVDAYDENLKREDLTPLDEARAFENMIEKGLAKTNEELAALLQQNVTRIRRVRRLSCAPGIVKDAVSAGLMVMAGDEKRELRRLELLPAIAFIRLHEHYKKSQPKKADERTEAAVRRALAAQWSLRRCEAYAEQVISGREESDPSPSEAPTGQLQCQLFSQTLRRFAVDLVKLKRASLDEVAALKAAFAALVDSTVEAGQEPSQQ